MDHGAVRAPTVGGASAIGGTVSAGGANATGGITSTGGTKAMGGAFTATGGTTTASGGAATATGGAISSGGAVATGGTGNSSNTSSFGGAPNTGGASASMGGATGIPNGLLNPDLTTTWDPGILADTMTNQPLGADNLPVRTAVCASVPTTSADATSAIQTALNNCAGTNKVVLLAAGTYKTSATIQMPNGVVLRGAGSDPAAGNATTIVSTNGGPVLAIGTEQDQSCYDSDFDSSAKPLLTADALKETSTLSVASGAEIQDGRSRAGQRKGH